MHCHHKINYLAPPKYHSIPALSQHYSVQRCSESSADIASPRSADTAVQLSRKVYLLHLFLESLSSWWGNLLELVQMPIATPRAINTVQPLTKRFPPLTQVLMKTNFSARNVFIRRKRVIYAEYFIYFINFLNCIYFNNMKNKSYTSTYILLLLLFSVLLFLNVFRDFTHSFYNCFLFLIFFHFENISTQKIFMLNKIGLQYNF